MLVSMRNEKNGGTKTLYLLFSTDEGAADLPMPSSTDMATCRSIIQEDNHIELARLINENPRYLVSKEDSPAFHRGLWKETLLTIAAKTGADNCFAKVLRLINDSSLYRRLYPGMSDVAALQWNVVDMYLNGLHNRRGYTPLHFAAEFGRLKIIEMLLMESQQNIGQLTKSGKSVTQLIDESSHITDRQREYCSKVGSLSYFLSVCDIY